ncbi:MAG: EF-hand domain-containing protein [Gallionella sp.]
MIKTTQYFIAVSSFVMCAGLAYADGDKCDSPMHTNAGVPTAESMFKSIDTNGDGKISKAEFNTHYAKHDGMRAKHAGAGMVDKQASEETTGGKVPDVGTSPATAHLDKRFLAADANHDGGLDKTEADGMPMLSTYFDEVDSNHDGKVTRQEYFDAMPLLHRGKNIDTSGKAQAL